jgi:uncharacterized protein
MSYDYGRFIWFELMTQDAKAAKRFYPEVLGWKLAEMDMGPAGKYAMFHAGETPIGGIGMQAPPGGVPNHWASYVSVEDVDATAKKVEAAGGKLLADAFDVPTVGRMQPVADNTGAAFFLFKGATEDRAAATGSGAFHWNELTTDDPEKAKSFYEQALGYSVEAMDMPQGKYYLFKNGEESRGGMMKSPHEGPNAWVQYITVESVDDALERCKSNGGKGLMGPMDVEGIGRFAVLADDTGAAFGVITPASA